MLYYLCFCLLYVKNVHNIAVDVVDAVDAVADAVFVDVAAVAVHVEHVQLIHRSIILWTDDDNSWIAGVLHLMSYCCCCLISCYCLENNRDVFLDPCYNVYFIKERV